MGPGAKRLGTGSSPEAHLARMVFRVRVRVRVRVLGLGLWLGHSRVLVRCASGLDPSVPNNRVLLPKTVLLHKTPSHAKLRGRVLRVRRVLRRWACMKPVRCQRGCYVMKQQCLCCVQACENEYINNCQTVLMQR